MKQYLYKTLLSVGILFAGIANAAPAQIFTVSAFNSLINSSTPVVVGFHSPSCGSCKVQKPNLEALLKEKEFSQVQGFFADFDDSESFRKSLAKPVRGPSTIVIFKGGQEVGRIQGVTNKNDLKSFLKESI